MRILGTPCPLRIFNIFSVVKCPTSGSTVLRVEDHRKANLILSALQGSTLRDFTSNATLSIFFHLPAWVSFDQHFLWHPFPFLLKCESILPLLGGNRTPQLKPCKNLVTHTSFTLPITKSV